MEEGSPSVGNREAREWGGRSICWGLMEKRAAFPSPGGVMSPKEKEPEGRLLSSPERGTCSDPKVSLAEREKREQCGVGTKERRQI